MLNKAMSRLADVLFGSLTVPSATPAASTPAEPATDPTPPALLASNATLAWHALPGQMLELGDSGFQITLHPAQRNSQLLYQLWGPAGEHLGGCSDLAHLKFYGEQKARERGEFVWRPATTRGWGE